MSRNTGLGAVRGLVVALAAVVATIVVGMLSFALGLVVGEPVLWWLGYPAAALMTGLAAALAAAWAANLLAPDRSRTRLWRVIGATEAAALAGVVLFLVLLLGGDRAGGPLATLLAPFALLVPATATFLTFRARRPMDPLRRDAITTAILLALIPVAWYGVIGIACLLGECGA